MKSVLGDAVIRLLNPITISSTSVQLHWTVEKPSPLFHGFQVLYRLVGYGGGGDDDDDDGGGGGGGSPWMSEEVRGASERAAVLSGLRKGAAYRVKVRPFHGDTRGEASAGRTLRTPEEAPGAPPQEVRLHPFTEENSTGVLVAWQPPPEEQHNGVLTEYKVWCGGNDSRLPVIRSVDGGTLSLTIPRLAGGVRYGLTVAAGNAAGVGPHSEPAYVLLDATSLSGPLERGDNVSLAEQISDVVRRPAFIAGIGTACWVVLMVFSVWLYRQRKKRAGLLGSSYASTSKVPSFTFTPSVTYQRGEGNNSTGRSGLMHVDASHHWLADTWPTAGGGHHHQQQHQQQHHQQGDCALGCCATAGVSSDSNLTNDHLPNFSQLGVGKERDAGCPSEAARDFKSSRALNGTAALLPTAAAANSVAAGGSSGSSGTSGSGDVCGGGGDDGEAAAAARASVRCCGGGGGGGRGAMKTFSSPGGREPWRRLPAAGSHEKPQPPPQPPQLQLQQLQPQPSPPSPPPSSPFYPTTERQNHQRHQRQQNRQRQQQQQQQGAAAAREVSPPRSPEDVEAVAGPTAVAGATTVAGATAVAGAGGEEGGGGLWGPGAEQGAIVTGRGARQPGLHWAHLLPPPPVHPDHHVLTPNEDGYESNGSFPHHRDDADDDADDDRPATAPAFPAASLRSLSPDAPARRAAAVGAPPSPAASYGHQSTATLTPSPPPRLGERAMGRHDTGSPPLSPSPTRATYYPSSFTQPPLFDDDDFSPPTNSPPTNSLPTNYLPTNSPPTNSPPTNDSAAATGFPAESAIRQCDLTLSLPEIGRPAAFTATVGGSLAGGSLVGGSLVGGSPAVAAAVVVGGGSGVERRGWGSDDDEDDDDERDFGDCESVGDEDDDEDDGDDDGDDDGGGEEEEEEERSGVAGELSPDVAGFARAIAMAAAAAAAERAEEAYGTAGAVERFAAPPMVSPGATPHGARKHRHRKGEANGFRREIPLDDLPPPPAPPPLGVSPPGAPPPPPPACRRGAADRHGDAPGKHRASRKPALLPETLPYSRPPPLPGRDGPASARGTSRARRRTETAP
ncbi:uncharacterized protein LOC144952018 [Lampetra fluviatilis]